MINIGGQVFRNRDVRDRVLSQNTTLSTGTATEIVTAKTGFQHDIVLVTGYNDSDAAITVTFTDVDTEKFRMTFAATAASQLKFDPPLNQAIKSTAWKADMGDTTNTNIYLLIQYVREGDVNDAIS